MYMDIIVDLLQICDQENIRVSSGGKKNTSQNNKVKIIDIQSVHNSEYSSTIENPRGKIKAGI